MADEEVVRVAILDNAVMARVSIDGYYSVEDGATHEVLSTGKDLRGAITAFKYALNIAARRYSQRAVILRPQEPDSIVVNGRRYTGCLAILRSRGSMTLVNYVGLEDYIKDIAVREISHYWPREALKAHAIVFRTYALFAAKQNSRRDYDLTADEYSQVYGGTYARRYRVTDACDETAGDILSCEGKIFPAYYHSTCGGHTQDASALWNIKIPALSGVDCAYCAKSPYFSWSATIAVSEVIHALSKAGMHLDGITAIETPDIDLSGRVVNVVLHTLKGETVSIAAKDFRQILGNNIVRSTNFRATLRGSKIEFRGKGWGHGVGLCQWGAYFMAKSGYSYREILSYYYPHSEIKNIHTADIR